jgi:hypothetical protein
LRHRRRQIACECYRDGINLGERLSLWADRTGLKKQPFYDRLNKAKASGLFEKVAGKSESRKPTFTEHRLDEVAVTSEFDQFQPEVI